jgi:hypothetical protein
VGRAVFKIAGNDWRLHVVGSPFSAARFRLTMWRPLRSYVSAFRKRVFGAWSEWQDLPERLRRIDL